MKTLTAGSTRIARPRAARSSMVQNTLLACGILSSLLYVAATIIGALRWKGYNFIDQAVSELNAIDAPSRPVVAPLTFLYSLLVIAFGFGVWSRAGCRRLLRVLAGLLVGYGAVCLTGPFTPMHLRGAARRTLTDTLHLVGAAVDVLFIFSIIGTGANAFGKRFRLYSFTTIAVLIACGIMSRPDLVKTAVDANLPTPLAGLLERILIFSYMLWQAVLAAGLMRGQAEGRSDS